MRKVFILLPLLGLFLSTCSNEFNIAAPWKSIPVVYAILSPADTAHYVRVEKAFLDPDASALTVAQIADSLYYGENDVAVYIENVANGNKVPLTRVNGTLEGFVREGGLFADDPNWLYKFKPSELTLDEGETYRLSLERADGSETVYAETTMPGGFLITNPFPNDIPPKITFATDQPTTVQFRSDENGLYFNVYITVKYREQDINGNLLRRDTITWLGAKNVKRSDIPAGSGGLFSGKADISGNGFFQFLVDSIPNQGTTPYRYFEGVDLTLEGGGKEIEDLLLTAQANSGLTGAEIFPTYTNLMPEGSGFGLFTGKSVFRMNNIRVTDATVDAMFDNPLTRPLNFSK
jgi:hypothetical protein